MSDESLEAISKFATEEANRFWSESGNTFESVANRGHDAAVDAILERGGKVKEFKITPWLQRNLHNAPTIEIRVTRVPDFNSGPSSKARFHFMTDKWDDHFARNALLYYINEKGLDDEFLNWLEANTTTESES